MKKKLIPLGICTLLICSLLTIPVTAEPEIRLPAETVNMKAAHGQNSWFSMTLSYVPAGFDITNGTYYGWCVEIPTKMNLNISYWVHLYSSYDAEMPTAFLSENWDKVNYLINHYDERNRESIQQAIWYFICADPVSPEDTDANELITDANQNGEGFIPDPNQKIAILVDVESDGNEVQRSFIELTLPVPPSLGDLVWNDRDADGLQDAGEPGLSGVTVELYNESNVKVDTTITDSNGKYAFSNYMNANYSIKFILKSGYLFTKQNIGTDDTIDSDANTTTGITPVFTANPDIADTSWDAGMYKPSSSNPDEPEPIVVKNRPPTADGTAGEPYMVLIDQEFIFNGSRSYDSDGTIVSYQWSFGDGTTTTGVIVTHKYTNIGNYPVVLTVTDDDGATDTYETTARYRLPNSAPLAPTITGSAEYHQNINYPFMILTTDPNGDDVFYIINWGDGSQDTTYLYTSGQNIQRSHRWTTFGFYTIEVSAQDEFNATSNVTKIIIPVDVEYIGDLGYLINTDGSLYYDAFYSNQTQSQQKAAREQTGVYLLDTNGDGDYDQQYNPATKTFRDYPEGLSPNYTMLLVGLIIVVILLLLIGFLIRRRRQT